MTRLRLAGCSNLLLLVAAGCASVPALPSLPTNSSVFSGPALTPPSFDMEAFSMPPVWQVPEVPADILKPVAGAPAQWWHWVPIHPAPQSAAEYEGGYHYTLDALPSEIQEYYRKALPQAGWEPRVDEFVTGDYSMFSYSRYGVSATIYVSPSDPGTIVSILLD